MEEVKKGRLARWVISKWFVGFFVGPRFLLPGPGFIFAVLRGLYPKVLTPKSSKWKEIRKTRAESLTWKNFQLQICYGLCVSFCGYGLSKLWPEATQEYPHLYVEDPHSRPAIRKKYGICKGDKIKEETREKKRYLT